MAAHRVLLTGAGGFAGSHCLEHLLATTDWDVVCTDSFRHKGKTDRITEVLAGHDDWRARVDVVTHDLTVPFSAQAADRIGAVDYILAYASESHVDRSITDPVPFIRNNVDVALSTLEFARQGRPRAVVLISTDEVYGPEPVTAAVPGLRPVPVPHREWAPIIPSNPYSASKAAQEAVATSYWRTYGVPVIIVNCQNMIGQRQDAEKFVPKVIRACLAGETVTIHGQADAVGTRHYLHARNLADGIVFLLGDTPVATFGAHYAGRREDARVHLADRPDRYNIASPDRLDNLTLAQMIAAAVGRPLRYQLEDFHRTRPGHDPHYGLDPGKITALGWKAPVPFEESLAHTVRWTLDHPAWLQ